MAVLLVTKNNHNVCMKGEWSYLKNVGKPWVVYGDVRPGEVHLRRKLAKSGLISIIA